MAANSTVAVKGEMVSPVVRVAPGAIGELLPTRFRYGTPCIVAMGQGERTLQAELLNLIGAMTLQSQHSAKTCLVANMDETPEIVENQRSNASTISEFFQKRMIAPHTYLTELYMRHIVDRASDRPYPPALAGLLPEEDNWYQTGIPGRLESIFLGDAGTFGTIHTDEPLGWGWIFLLTGCKRVLMFPPEVDAEKALAQLYDPSLLGHKAFAMELRPADVQVMCRLGAQEAMMKPGDLLVIPSGWWHQITNVEDNTLSYVDMVLEPFLMHKFCTHPKPYKHAVPDVLREIVPYRTNQTLTLASNPTTTNRVRLRELMDGLVQLLYGIEQVAQSLSTLTEKTELEHLRLEVAEALIAATNALKLQ